MTDRELYRKTFSQVHARSAIRWEDMNVTKRKRVSTRVLAVAAVVAVLCALMGAAVAVNFLGLGDLLLPKPLVTPEGGTSAVPADSPDFISLSGYMDSPESQALGEWQAFLDGYDENHRILEAADNTVDPALDRYSCYYVYSREMGEKLDEICEKYGLKLHTDRIDLYAHPEALASCEGYAADNVTAWPMYMYEDGTFAFDGQAVIGSSILDIQFRRSVRGTFNEVILNVMDVTEFRQWQYRTGSGVTVLLALGTGKGLVLADLPDCFVTLNVLMGTDSGVTQANLEALADSFDYTKLSPVVAPSVPREAAATPAPAETASAVESPAQKAQTAREAFVRALKDFYYDGLFPDGTQSEQYGQGRPLSDQNRFAVRDVDGDGEEELIVLYTTVSTAGHAGFVMAFDPDYTGPGAPLRTELRDYPLFTFYAGGAVEVGWSHNQGLAGDALWPYDRYAYDHVLDSYGLFASVDAWDKSTLETNYDGAPFPDDIDADGDGMVYYVRPAGTDGVIAPMDGPEYQAWREAGIGDTTELTVDYQPLDIDHINALLGGG